MAGRSRDAVLRDVAQRMWDVLDDDVEGSPWDTLDAYIRSHVQLALRHAEVIGLWYSEQGTLPAIARTEQRALQRRIVERWVDVLLRCRPELDAAEARTRIHAGFGLIHSVIHLDPELDRDAVGEILVTMTTSALAA